MVADVQNHPENLMMTMMMMMVVGVVVMKGEKQMKNCMLNFVYIDIRSLAHFKHLVKTDTRIKRSSNWILAV